MATYIRLTDYKSSDEKEQEFSSPENRYEAKQEDFSKIPATPIAYWVSENLANSFLENRISDIADTRLGMATADNDKFLRFWNEIEFEKIGLGYSNKNDANESGLKWFPYQKGGEYRKWYGNYEYMVNWQYNGQEIQSFTNPATGKIRSHNYNLDYIFRKGITWNALSSGSTSMRISENSLFDNAGSSMFLKNEDDLIYCLSVSNTKIIPLVINAVSPTLNYQPGDIAKIPILITKNRDTKEHIETLTQQNIDISKEEWDSRETSWDFTKNELIKHKSDTKIESSYSNYCNYWKKQYNTLHENEEELNKLFIDIYELQDELTPDVELKDITILKSETKIIDGKLVFQADEIMKQFISYGVGVMFGRYSLDSDGLLIANMNQEVPTDTTFEIDDDNVIPVLEDDYFSDDIASRFVEFVKVVFGEAHLKENIKFIENSLDTTIRKYFIKGFYEDHIKRYKKRPIYWMVSSPKKGFNTLSYMHRYQSDIFATVQNDYLREYITKLEASGENYQREADDSSNSNIQRDRATKQVEKITKTLDEVIKFDREVLTAYAQGRIELDLDDGVKVNYCKFKDVLYEFDKKLCE